MSDSSGYFDLQINGFAGIDFQKQDLGPDALHRACEALQQQGVGGVLVTIITERIDRMCALLSRIAQLRECDPLAKRVIAGFHVEGPFISEIDGYRGAHPLDAVRPANVDWARRLLDAGRGLVRIVTLAPERDPHYAVIRMLVREGVAASAGHCNPSFDELRGAIDAGLSMFTHLGNGCPMQLHRHDNIIQRALALHDRLWLCFIADGAHVPLHALGNYLRSINLDRCVIVTDAIAPAGLGPGRYTVGRWDLIVGEDMVAMAPDRSHLIGSACTMRQAERNLVEKLGIPPQRVRQLVCDNPRRAIGL